MDNIAELRKSLRETILTEAILDEDSNLEIRVSFDGYNDSGQAYFPDRSSSYADQLQKLINYMIQTHVDWDWWNNDGGGGEVIWDVKKDKIIINGYQNETIQNVMLEDFEAEDGLPEKANV